MVPWALSTLWERFGVRNTPRINSWRKRSYKQKGCIETVVLNPWYCQLLPLPADSIWVSAGNKAPKCLCLRLPVLLIGIVAVKETEWEEVKVLSSGALKFNWAQGDLRRLFLSILPLSWPLLGKDGLTQSKDYACVWWTKPFGRWCVQKWILDLFGESEYIVDTSLGYLFGQFNAG